MLVVTVHLDSRGHSERRTALARLAIANVGAADDFRDYHYVWTLTELPCRGLHSGVPELHGELVARRNRPALLLLRDVLHEAFATQAPATAGSLAATPGLARFIRENAEALRNGEGAT